MEWTSILLVIAICGLLLIIYDAQDGVDIRIKLLNGMISIVYWISGFNNGNFNRDLFEGLSYKPDKLRKGEYRDMYGVRRWDVFIPSLYHDTDQVRVRLYRSDLVPDANTKVMLFTHGGGHCIGHIDQPNYDNMCAYLAYKGNLLVVSVEYRLAPEYPFPCGLEDAYSALVWTHRNLVNHNHHIYGSCSSSLILCGDSAGGNMAAVLSHLSRDGLTPELNTSKLQIKINSVILIYPSVDRGATPDKYPSLAFEDAYLIPKASRNFFGRSYRPHNRDVNSFSKDPRVAPMQNPNFKNLPPHLVITGELDPLRDEGGAYVSKLRQHGVYCDHLYIKNTFHGFMSFSFLKEADEAFKHIIEHLKRY